MADGAVYMARNERLAAAKAMAYATPLAEFQVADVSLFTSDTHWPWFERLRNENLVHWRESSEFGPH